MRETFFIHTKSRIKAILLGCLLLSETMLFAQRTELRKNQRLSYPEYLISPNGRYTAEFTEYGLSLCKRENDGSKPILWKSHHEPFQEHTNLSELSIALEETGDLRLYRNTDVIWHRPSNNRMLEGLDLRARVDDLGIIVLEFFNNNIIWLQYGNLNRNTPSDFNKPQPKGGPRIKILPIPAPFQW